MYDSLNAFSVADHSVEVTEMVMSSAQFSAVVSNLFADSSENVDQTKQVLSVASSMLNVVNCSHAPNCGSLNRHSCVKTAHTCGSCYSNYTGISGDSNERCISPLYLNTTSNRVGACASNDDCGLWSVCNTTAGFCDRLSKDCPAGCSGHGACIAEGIYSGLILDDCKQGNVTCDVYCSCATNYTGIDCSTAPSELLAKQELRSELISRLDGIVKVENPSSDSIISWASNLGAISQNVDEIPGSAVDTMLSIMNSIVDESQSSRDVSSDDLSAVVDSMDSVSQVTPDTNSSNSRRRRRLTTDNSGLESVLRKYADMISTEMVPRQSSKAVVRTNFRYACQMLGADASLDTPLSFTESANNLSPMGVDISLSGVDSVGVNTIVMDASMYNNSGYNSNPLFLSLSQTPCSNSTQDCMVNFTLRNNIAINVGMVVTSNITGESYNATCYEGINATSTFLCSNGVELVQHCDGIFVGTVILRCPIDEHKSLCNSVGGSDNGCIVIDYTDAYTYCSCPVGSSGSGRRLTALSNDTVGVNFVSMLETVTHEFASTWVSVGSLDAAAVVQSLRVLVTTAILIAAAGCALVAANRSDEKVEMVKKKLHNNRDNMMKVAGAMGARGRSRKFTSDTAPERTEYSDLSRSAITKLKVLESMKNKNPKKLSSEELFIEEAIPDLKTESFSDKFATQVKVNHKWFGVIFHYSSHFPRVMRVLTLVTGVFTMLFMQAVLYPIMNPDDGECELETRQEGCMALESSFSAGVAKCIWHSGTEMLPDGSIAGSCVFSPPGDSMKTVLFMAILAIILGAPVSILADTLIMKVLAAPVIPRGSVGVAQESEDPLSMIENGASSRSGSQGSRFGSMGSRSGSTVERADSIGSRFGSMGSRFGSTVERADSIGARFGSRVGSIGARSGSLSNLLGNNIGISNAHIEELGSTLNEDLSEFMNQLLHYRNEVLNEGIEREEFDTMWGLNSAGHFRSEESELSLLGKMFGKAKDVHKMILADLAKVRAKAAKEITYLSLPNITDKERGHRLVRLFHQDLLPGLSSQLVETSNTSSAPTPVSHLAKVLVGCFIALLNGSMLFYIYLFALNQPHSQQDAWFKSFIIQIVMDTLIVATVMVYIKHILIPSFAMKDVHAIRQKLVDAVKNGVTNSKPEEKQIIPKFDATQFFFVSTRVVKRFPHLKESSIVEKFHTPWPKQSYQHLKDVSKGYSNKLSAFKKSVAMVVTFLLTSFIEIPEPVQEMVIELFSAASFGAVFFGFIGFFSSNPAGAVGSVIAVGIMLHFAYKWCSDSKPVNKAHMEEPGMTRDAIAHAKARTKAISKVVPYLPKSKLGHSSPQSPLASKVDTSVNLGPDNRTGTLLNSKRRGVSATNLPSTLQRIVIQGQAQDDNSDISSQDSDQDDDKEKDNNDSESEVSHSNDDHSDDDDWDDCDDEYDDDDDSSVISEVEYDYSHPFDDKYEYNFDEDIILELAVDDVNSDEDYDSENDA